MTSASLIHETGHLKPVLWDNPEGWGGERGGRGAQVGDTCAPVFITALFRIARTWKQPRCPLADKWIRKVWYIYTME